MSNSSVGPSEYEPEAVALATDTTDEVPINPEFGKKVPKRILHFSDGTIEEYSSDEEECKKETVQPAQVANANPANMEWVPWLSYHSHNAGNKALAACDYLGEHLANFFGILTPKYEYEIEQYKKIQAQEEEKRKQDCELGGFNQTPSTEVVSTDPKSQDGLSAVPAVE